MERQTAMITAYVITIVAYVLYAFTLWIRHRNLERRNGQSE
jgi:hypothetical protein